MSADRPPVEKPGFDLYADQRGRIIGSCAVILSLSISFVALRLLSRRLSRAGYWWDDLLTVISLVFSNVCCIIWLIEIPNGYGRHIFIFGPVDGLKKTKRWMKGLFIFELFFHTATVLSKFAILAFYHRILPIRAFRRICICVAVVSLLYLISVILTIIFQCQPIHYAWDRFEPGAKGHCYNVDRFFIGSGSINIALNFVIFLLPIPLLWRLRTTHRQQIILTALFTLAGFVVLVSIIWVIVLSRLELRDITWNYINAGIWSALEPNMAVICACIPSLRPLASYYASKLPRLTNTPNPLVRRIITPRSSSSAGDGSSSLSSKRLFDSGKGRPSVGTFSPIIEDPDEASRPLGHDVYVRAGRVGQGCGQEGEGEGEGMELPEQGIKVRTEVILSTSERLHYDDRLF